MKTSWITKEVEDFIVENISYCPLTGMLTAKKDRHKIKEGQLLGKIDDHGYVKVSVGNQKRIRAHRVAWFLSYGCWPSDMIDHINRVRHDNRLSNLREADAKLNACNSPQKEQGLKNPYRFIYWDSYSQRWCSVIGKSHRINGYAGKRSFKVSKYGYEEAKRLAQGVE